MDLGQRNEVIDVQLPGVGEHPPRIGIFPAARDNFATGRAEGHGDRAFGNQDLIPSVLAISILINLPAVKFPLVGDYGSEGLRSLGLGAEGLSHELAPVASVPVRARNDTASGKRIDPYDFISMTPIFVLFVRLVLTHGKRSPEFPLGLTLESLGQALVAVSAT